MGWVIRNNKLLNTESMAAPSEPFHGDSPHIFWKNIGGRPALLDMLSSPDLGAFANANELSKVSIPKSCKFIGKTAFKNTKITSVTIASDCTYSDTSFPEGCAINFYPD